MNTSFSSSLRMINIWDGKRRLLAVFGSILLVATIGVIAVLLTKNSHGENNDWRSHTITRISGEESNMNCFDSVGSLIDYMFRQELSLHIAEPSIEQYIESWMNIDTELVGVSSDIISRITTKNANLRLKEIDYKNAAITVEYTELNDYGNVVITGSVKLEFDASGSNMDVESCKLSKMSWTPSGCSGSNQEINSLCCFDADSIVYRKIGETDEVEAITLREINHGDMVMTGTHGEFSEVIEKLHFENYENNDGFETISSQNNLGSLLEICFNNKDEECIRASQDHLLFVNGIDLDNLLPAKRVNIGDSMCNVKDPTNPVESFFDSFSFFLCVCVDVARV